MLHVPITVPVICDSTAALPFTVTPSSNLSTSNVSFRTTTDVPSDMIADVTSDVTSSVLSNVTSDVMTSVTWSVTCVNVTSNATLRSPSDEYWLYVLRDLVALPWVSSASCSLAFSGQSMQSVTMTGSLAIAAAVQRFY